jgi:hypothetical protein
MVTGLTLHTAAFPAVGTHLILFSFMHFILLPVIFNDKYII